MGKLKTLRSRALFYVHGHSAGGTNPSLVEAMHFGNSAELQQLVESLDKAVADKVGRDMLEIANRRYTWRMVAQQYFELLDA